MEFEDTPQEIEERNRKTAESNRGNTQRALADPTKQSRLESFIKSATKYFQKEGFLYLRENCEFLHIYGDLNMGSVYSPNHLISSYSLYSEAPYDTVNPPWRSNENITLEKLLNSEKGLLPQISKSLHAEGIETIAHTSNGDILLITNEESRKTTSKLVNEITQKYDSSAEIEIQVRGPASGVIGYRVTPFNGKPSLKAYNGLDELTLLEDSCEGIKMFGQPAKLSLNPYDLSEESQVGQALSDGKRGITRMYCYNNENYGINLEIDFANLRVSRTGMSVPADLGWLGFV